MTILFTFLIYSAAINQHHNVRNYILHHTWKYCPTSSISTDQFQNGHTKAALYCLYTFYNYA